jgi:predicted house-cleaning NTP pyrophosphatase (Maf/HAM1 superfamily)
MDILLASKSPTRAKLLESAGIAFQAVDHGVDEEEVKLAMSSHKPKEVAVKLSELKALKSSSSDPITNASGFDEEDFSALSSLSLTATSLGLCEDMANFTSSSSTP